MAAAIMRVHGLDRDDGSHVTKHVDMPSHATKHVDMPVTSKHVDMPAPVATPAASSYDAFPDIQTSTSTSTPAMPNPAFSRYDAADDHAYTVPPNMTRVPSHAPGITRTSTATSSRYDLISDVESYAAPTLKRERTQMLYAMHPSNITSHATPLRARTTMPYVSTLHVHPNTILHDTSHLMTRSSSRTSIDMQHGYHDTTSHTHTHDVILQTRTSRTSVSMCTGDDWNARFMRAIEMSDETAEKELNKYR